MTAQPPPNMPNFERPPTPAQPLPPTQTTPATTPAAAAASRAQRPTNVFARRPWVAAAAVTGTVIVAAAGGYGLGRQADPSSTTATGTDTTVGTGGDPTSGGTIIGPGQGGPEGSDEQQIPGSDDGSDQTQVLPGGPSEGFGGQPGLVIPGQGGPTTQSGGS